MLIGLPKSRKQRWVGNCWLWDEYFLSPSISNPKLSFIRKIYFTFQWGDVRMFSSQPPSRRVVLTHWAGIRREFINSSERFVLLNRTIYAFTNHSRGRAGRELESSRSSSPQWSFQAILHLLSSAKSLGASELADASFQYRRWACILGILLCLARFCTSRGSWVAASNTSRIG